MFKNSFWIQLKGTRTLRLPGAVTRMQKPAKGASRVGSSLEGEGFLAPGPHTNAENPAVPLPLSLSHLQPPLYPLDPSARQEEGKERHWKPHRSMMLLVSSCDKIFQREKKKLKVLNTKVLTDGWRAWYLCCPWHSRARLCIAKWYLNRSGPRPPVSAGFRDVGWFNATSSRQPIYISSPAWQVFENTWKSTMFVYGKCSRMNGSKLAILLPGN